MRIWTSQPTIALIRPHRIACWCGRNFALWNERLEIQAYTRTRLGSNLATLQMWLSTLSLMEGEDDGMVDAATGRWNPKPSVGFERKQHGRIIVMGNEVLQFDMDWKLLHKTETSTHFIAIQQAILMIGAMAPV